MEVIPFYRRLLSDLSALKASNKRKYYLAAIKDMNKRKTILDKHHHNRSLELFVERLVAFDN
jgi:hypothetical protein